MFAYGPESLPGRVAMYLGNLVEQFPPLLLALAVLGVLVTVLWDRAVAALLGFFLLGSLAFALWAAMGLSWLLATLRDLIGACSAPFARLFPALLLLTALVTLAPHAAAAYREEDQSENLRSRRIVETVARNVEQGAIVIGGRNLPALRYMQFVEDRRTDLTLVRVMPWNVERLSDAALRRGTTYFIGTRVSAAKSFGETGYSLVPVEPDVLYEIRAK
jgi:hypothetical protein